MSEVKRYSHVLPHIGQNQDDRLLKALLPEYVKIDERTREDFIQFAKKFSTLIQYYDTSNKRKGTWETFFDDSAKADQPHYALFLAFLYVFRHAQQDINTLTARHLDHYYKEILKLKSKPAISDTVHLLFTLAKNVENHRIEKGTLLKAGKDATGKELFYATDQEIVLNKITIASLKTVFLEPLQKSDGKLQKINGYGLYASPVANSTDGLGTDSANPNLDWKIAGESQEGKVGNFTMPMAEVGLAIASPILLLREGLRSMTLRFSFVQSLDIDFIPYYLATVLSSDSFNISEADLLARIFINSQEKYSDETDEYTFLERLALKLATPPSDYTTFESSKKFEHNKKLVKEKMSEAFKAQLENCFTISLSGEKEWIGPIVVSGDRYNDRQIEVTLHLDATIPPVVAFDTNKLEGGFVTTNPLLKLLLNKVYPTSDSKNSPPFVYHFLKNQKMFVISIDTTVKGIKNLIIQSDTATLDAHKPFLPFGPTPTLGSSLFIGSEEVFQKKLDTFSLDITWFDVPENLDAHYDSYISNNATRKIKEEESTKTRQTLNDAFQGKVELLHHTKPDLTTYPNQEIKQESPWAPLFIIGKDSSSPNGVVNLFKNKATDTTSINVSLKRSNIKSYDWPQSISTFNRFDNSTRNGFIRLQLTGADLPELKAFGHKAYPKLYTESLLKKSVHPNDSSIVLPNEPYTPTIQSLSIDYTAKGIIQTGQQHQNAHEQFFHIGPFGHKEVNLAAKSISFLPEFNEDGTLYIGLKDVKAPQSVSILFQLNEKNIDHQSVGKVEINWSYLSNNEWIDFSEKEIIADATNLFTKSGIITFIIPKHITDRNTILPAQYYWIRACIPANTLGVADASSIKAQAVTATFVDIGNDPMHLSTTLPSDTIKKFKINNTAVKTIEQPHQSFDGQLQESDQTFYFRVSERLRHKRRSITNWDYERITLEAFPSIYKVRCLNHTYHPVGERMGCQTYFNPGAVTLLIISKIEEDTTLENKLTPITNLITLNKIKHYLTGIMPPFVSLRQKLVVRNPSYESVKINCSVKFHEGYDTGYYLKEIDTSIKKFLSPWAFDSKRSITFERKIYKSVIINYLEELDYVNFVCCFKMYHYIDNVSDLIDRDTIEPLSAVAVLISHTEHTIDYVEGDECDCGSKHIVIDPKPEQGIGVMIVGIDFIVSKE